MNPATFTTEVFNTFGSMPSANSFAYEAVVKTKGRKPLTGILQSEDAELPPALRSLLVSGTRDITRNFSVARWMVARHLDYVTTFTFRSRLKDSSDDRWLRSFVEKWSHRKECDVAKRHPLQRQVRMAEGRSVLDGDILLLKTPTGHIQAIEGDRVRSPYAGGLPKGYSGDEFTHGVKLDQYGAAESYIVCNRAKTTDFGKRGSDFTFERIVPADAVIHHGFFDRFDQVRGVTPLSSCLNELRDTYAGTKYALGKLKASQLLGFNVYRESGANLPNQQVDEDGNPVQQDYTKLPLGESLWLADLDPGDRMELLESKNPSQEFQAFVQVVISLALKSLDIPFSFFNESFTNYSGARQALLQYQQAAAIRRREVREIYMELTQHRLEIARADGYMPKGIQPEDFLYGGFYTWVASGLPWIDPLKEAQAEAVALGQRTTSRQRVCNSRGEDWFDIADELAEEDAYLSEKGITSSAAVDSELTKILLKDGSNDEAGQPGGSGQKTTRTSDEE